MRPFFCPDVENVARFTKGVELVRKRGAVEASWLVIDANPGLGKSTTLEWFSVQEDAALVRAKAGWTVSWALRDIALALDLEPRHSAKANFDQIVGELVVRERPLIVDEINHAAKRIRVLETLRDITDMTQTVLIAGGHKGTGNTLKAHPQIYDRVAQFVEFGPCTLRDVRALCDTQCEVAVSDSAVAEIHRQAGGVHRNVMNAIARVEAIGRRLQGDEVTREMIGTQRLTNDGRVRGAA